ncbi:MAG: hypothetical protein K0S38_817 [Candidatus Paceibacter sp.]|jgi:hypothetical protein|nr:hypothetical protein [Candidatus Paceibacter sp.]
MSDLNFTPDPPPTKLSTYMELIHEHGVGADVPEAFKAENADDVKFIQEAQHSERLFVTKDPILKELDEMEDHR